MRTFHNTILASIALVLLAASCKKAEDVDQLDSGDTFIKFFEFDSSKIGTIEYYGEFDRIFDLLNEEYFSNKLSIE